MAEPQEGQAKNSGANRRDGRKPSSACHRMKIAHKTADDCAQMLQILSGTPVESTDEPFLPPARKSARPMRARNE